MEKLSVGIETEVCAVCVWWGGVCKHIWHVGEMVGNKDHQTCGSQEEGREETETEGMQHMFHAQPQESLGWGWWVGRRAWCGTFRMRRSTCKGM